MIESDQGHVKYYLLQQQQKIQEQIGKAKRWLKDKIDKVVVDGLDVTGAEIISTELNMDDIEVEP